MLWVVAVTLLIALTMYLSIAGWARERRLEREAFYEQEIARRMLDREGAAVAEVTAWLEARESKRSDRRLQALRLGAYLSAAAGIGMLAGLRGVSRDHVYWPLGIVPLLIGAALALYVSQSSDQSNEEDS